MNIQSLRGFASKALAMAGIAFLGQSVASAAPLLMVDVNDRTPLPTPFGSTDGSSTDSGTQAGFVGYLLGSSGDVGNGYTMAISGIGGIVDDRDRNFTFPGTLEYAELYDDFVFQNSNTGILTLTVSGPGLLPNTQYVFSIYAYDHSSTGTRTASWTDQNNGGAVVTATSFTGGAVPATNDTYKFSGFALTDSNGALNLRGNNTSPIPPSGTNQGVFISGFEISAVPEPTTALGLLSLAGLLVARRRGR